MYFQLLKGVHVDSTIKPYAKHYKAGDVIETDRDLVKLFGFGTMKFRRLSEKEVIAFEMSKPAKEAQQTKVVNVKTSAQQAESVKDSESDTESAKPTEPAKPAKRKRVRKRVRTKRA